MGIVLIYYLEKQKKWAFMLDEGEETDLDYRNSKKHWKRHEDNNSEEDLGFRTESRHRPECE